MRNIGVLLLALGLAVVAVWVAAESWTRESPAAGPGATLERSVSSPSAEASEVDPRAPLRVDSGADGREEVDPGAPGAPSWVVLGGRVSDSATGAAIEGVEVAPPGNWLGPPTVRSDPSGRFSMPCGPIAPHSLVLTPPAGWSPTVLRVELTEEQRRGIGELAFEFTRLPEGTFQVLLVDRATGEPLPSFQLVRTGAGSGRQVEQSNERGWVLVDGLSSRESWSLLDWIDGANVARPVLAMAEVLAAAEGPLLRVPAPVGPTYELMLEGLPTAESVRLLGSLRVSSSRAPIEDQGGAPAPVRFGAAGPWVRLAPLPSVFESPALDETRWLVLTCADPPLRGVAEVRTLVGRASERVRIALRSALRLAGRVVARDGTPIADVRLHFLVETHEGPERRVAFSDAHGAYALEGVPADTSAIHVTALVEGFDLRTEELTPFAASERESARRDLTLDREDASAFIAGRIEGAVDRLEDTKVTVMNIEPPFAQPRTAELVMDPSGDAGSFRVEGIPPGRYSLKVGGWASIEFTPVEMEVVAPVDGLRIQSRERGKAAGEILARCSGAEPIPGTAWLVRHGDVVAAPKRFYCGVQVWDGALVRAGDLAVLALTGHQPVATEITSQLLQSGGSSWWIDAEGPKGWGALVRATVAGDPVVGLELRAPGGEVLGITDDAGLAVLAADTAPSTLELGGQGWIVAGKPGSGTSIATRSTCEWIDLKLE